MLDYVDRILRIIIGIELALLPPIGIIFAWIYCKQSKEEKCGTNISGKS